jgi:hypothetical protein
LLFRNDTLRNGSKHWFRKGVKKYRENRKRRKETFHTSNPLFAGGEDREEKRLRYRDWDRLLDVHVLNLTGG